MILELRKGELSMFGMLRAEDVQDLIDGDENDCRSNFDSDLKPRLISDDRKKKTGDNHVTGFPCIMKVNAISHLRPGQRTASRHSDDVKTISNSSRVDIWQRLPETFRSLTRARKIPEIFLSFILRVNIYLLRLSTH